jgi:hypothetical protein
MPLLSSIAAVTCNAFLQADLPESNHVIPEILLFRRVLMFAIEEATEMIVLPPPIALHPHRLDNYDYLKIMMAKNIGRVAMYNFRVRNQKYNQAYFEEPNKDFNMVCDLAEYEPAFVKRIYYYHKKNYDKQILQYLPQRLQDYKEIREKTIKLIEELSKTERNLNVQQYTAYYTPTFPYIVSHRCRFVMG